MACSKIRKVDPENRHFKDEWTDQYLFILPQGSTKPLLCLLCVETVALIKSGNIKRHYESKHRSFEEKTVVKECLNAAAETLLEGKQRDELSEKIKLIPM